MDQTGRPDPVRPSPRDRVPIGAMLLAVACFAALAVSTVWGAIASSYAVSEPYRSLLLREERVAAAASLDLDALRRGKVEYMKTCTACHGPNGEAKPNLGKDLRHSEFVAGRSDAQMKMFLKLGRNTWEPENTTGVAMPPKGGNPMITDDGLVDIVQYLRFLQAAAQN